LKVYPSPKDESAPRDYIDTPPSKPLAVRPFLAPAGVTQMVYPQPPVAEPIYPIIVGQPVSGQVGYLPELVERHQEIPTMMYFLIGFFLVLLVGSAAQFLLTGAFPTAIIGTTIFGVVLCLLSQTEGLKAHTCTLDVRTGSVTVEAFALHHKVCGRPSPITFNARDVTCLGWFAVGKHGHVHLLYFTVNETNIVVSRHGGGCGCEGDSEVREAAQFWITQLARCGSHPRHLGGIRKYCMC